LGEKLKRALSRGASAAGAAIVLSAVGFAGPAQATTACWSSAYSASGTTCREFGESAAGLAKVRAAEQPTFAGILKAGQTLTSSSGLWLFGQGAETKTLKFQWLRDGVVIPGAGDENYEITESDTGRSLALRVTASAPGVNDGVETTLPSPKVSDTNTAEYTARPGITGEAPTVSGWTRVGFTLDVGSVGTWSPGWMDVTLQWQADGVDIEGATADEYKIRLADLGKKVTLKVTGSSAGVPSVSKSNTSTAVTRGYIRAPDEIYVTGGDKVGSILSVVETSGWDADGEPVTRHYEWRRDNQPIPGATASTYTVVAADSGHRIDTLVTATAPGHGPNTQISYYTEIVDSVTDGTGETDPGTQPGPVPVPQPAPVPAPTKPAPVPVPQPAPVPEVPVPAPTKPAPVPAPAEEAPALQLPAVQPPARTSSAPRYLAPVKASVTAGDASGQPVAAGQVQADGFNTFDSAGTVAPPAEAAPAVPAPVASPSPSPAPSRAPSPAPSPAPSASSGPAAAATTATAADSPFNPLPLFFTIAGILIAAGLVWVIRPLRTAVARIAGRKTP
jgi:hypothetical protein